MHGREDGEPVGSHAVSEQRHQDPPRSGGDAPIGWLALSRSEVDRAAVRRADTEWLARAWDDPRTRVLPVDDGQAPVLLSGPPASSSDRPRLAFVPPDQAGDGERYLLGVDGDGVAYFATGGRPAGVDGAEPAGLRRVGALLDDRDAGLLTQAVALRNWHERHPRCPRCGDPTELAQAGYARQCPTDGSQHFPRVDPAVIMLVHDGAPAAAGGSCLLARGAAWPAGRMSILAGFVEPGESIERTVVREVAEEVGLAVTDPHYLGSQPWPLPQSLMLGFLARATGDPRPRPDSTEIAEARWFTRTQLRTAFDAGELLLPPRVSIARRLIERWYGGDLPEAHPA